VVLNDDDVVVQLFVAMVGTWRLGVIVLSFVVEVSDVATWVLPVGVVVVAMVSDVATWVFVL
jgi:hypothetical protein